MKIRVIYTVELTEAEISMACRYAAGLGLTVEQQKNAGQTRRLLVQKLLKDRGIDGIHNMHERMTPEEDDDGIFRITTTDQTCETKDSD